MSLAELLRHINEINNTSFELVERYRDGEEALSSGLTDMNSLYRRVAIRDHFVGAGSPTAASLPISCERSVQAHCIVPQS